MSKWKVVYTKGAEQNLRDIYEYIAFTLLEPDTAAGQAERIMEAIAKLDHMPLRFQEYEHEPWRSKGLRYVPVDHYVVFYYPNEAHQVVSIMRIMYGGRDVQAQLQLAEEE